VVRGLDPALLAPFADGAALERLLDELLMTWSNNPAAELVASLPTPATDALITVARQCRSVADARKVHVGVADFGDLLTRLAERLRDPRHAETIATTYRVLLIDEFQDTDSLQVEIFQRLCETGRLKAFVVVGDPKQAIYGFRGGDVQVYREAVPAGRASYLTGNRRSSRAYVEGANEFFSGVNFGFTVPATAVTAAGYEVADVDIDYVPVTAEGPLRDQGDQPAWFFRFAHGTKADDIQRSIRDDLAAYISALVRDDVLIDPRDGRRGR
jgi:exodeoxyribonuclease V beta subunit